MQEAVFPLLTFTLLEGTPVYPVHGDDDGWNAIWMRWDGME